MSATSVSFTCPNCGWANTYTRDEVMHKRYRTVYRDDYEEYSVPCKNPRIRPACPYHEVIAVPKQPR
jgi:hypothetical protein